MLAHMQCGACDTTDGEQEGEKDQSGWGNRRGRGVTQRLQSTSRCYVSTCAFSTECSLNSHANGNQTWLPPSPPWFHNSEQAAVVLLDMLKESVSISQVTLARLGSG